MSAKIRLLNLRRADAWKEEKKLFFPGLSFLRNANVKLLFRTLYLGCLPSIRTRFPSICICTLTKSVGLAINWPNAPAVIPAMTDFLKVIPLVQWMSYEHHRTVRATEVLISFLWPIPYVPVSKSIPCIFRPPFWSRKIRFSYFGVRILLINLSFILEFYFRYAIVTWKICAEFFLDLSFCPMYKSRAIFWTDF